MSTLTMTPTFRLTRIAPGLYEVIVDGRTYEVARHTSAHGPWWGWNRQGQTPNDAHLTLADARAALADWLSQGGE